MGTVQLYIAKSRQGLVCPSLLAHRRRAERALLSVIQEAYSYGVGTRKVDVLVMGFEGVSKNAQPRVARPHGRAPCDQRHVRGEATDRAS